MGYAVPEYIFYILYICPYRQFAHFYAGRHRNVDEVFGRILATLHRLKPDSKSRMILEKEYKLTEDFSTFNFEGKDEKILRDILKIIPPIDYATMEVKKKEMYVRRRRVSSESNDFQNLGKSFYSILILIINF